MEIKIEKIKSSQFDQLKDLAKSNFLENYPEFSKRIKDFFVDPQNLNWLLQERWIMLGAFVDTRMVGYVLATHPMGGVSFCIVLGISPDYQRKGIGQKILAEYEQLVKSEGGHGIRLESDILNLEFYKKQGYSIIGLDEKGYWGTDNYLLKKTIQEPKEENFLK